MSYIGASLADVKAALKKRGRVSLSGGRAGRTYDIGGVGAVKLSIRLARQLVDRWWASPGGTKIVLGFFVLGGKKDLNYGLPMPTGVAMKAMEIVRPPRTQSANQPRAQTVFQRLVVEKMRRMGEHQYVNYAQQPYEQRRIGLYLATWFKNPKAWPQPYLVWPAGILSNRNAEAVARVQKGWQVVENTRHVLPNMYIPHDTKQYSNRWVTPAIFNARRALRSRALSRTNTRPLNVRRREFYNLEKATNAARRNGAAAVIQRSVRHALAQRKSAAATIQRILLERIYRPDGQMSGVLKKRFEAKRRNMTMQTVSRKRKR
jgi:hypothetical protein